MSSAVPRARHAFYESRSSGLERKLGGKFHLKLNMGSKPIANKYHEGKMKRTLKRELKVLEIAELEANGTSALVEIAASGCDIWALERKSFVWFEVVACNVSQLECQLLCIREDGPWLMLCCCGDNLVLLGIQVCVDC